MRTCHVLLVVALALLLSLGGPAEAQEISISMGQNNSLTANGVQLFLLVTVLSLAPGLAIMVTCFPFLVTVLSILRQAIGLQQSPPNMLIVSLALFLTYYVMDPVFTDAWVNGLQPFLNEKIPLDDAVVKILGPFRVFMSHRIDPQTFETLVSLRPRLEMSTAISEAPLSVLVPSFLLSEIARAFQIGFLIFLPFLVIDLVVSAILMSMGMMMVPPAIVSLPFKLSFFVVADGWSLIAGSLVKGYF